MASHRSLQSPNFPPGAADTAAATLVFLV